MSRDFFLLNHQISGSTKKSFQLKEPSLAPSCFFTLKDLLYQETAWYSWKQSVSGRIPFTKCLSMNVNETKLFNRQWLKTTEKNGRMSERSETTTENWITCFGKLSLSNKQLLAKICLGAWKSIISSYFGGFSPFWNETCPSQMVDHLPQFNHVGFETTGCHLLRFGRWQICNMRDIHNTLRLRRMSPWPPTAKNLVHSTEKRRALSLLSLRVQASNGSTSTSGVALFRGSHHTVELQGSLWEEGQDGCISNICVNRNITCIHYQTYPSLIFSFLHNSLTWHHFCFRRNSTKKYMNRNCTARITSSSGKRGVVTRNRKPVRPFSEF